MTNMSSALVTVLTRETHPDKGNVRKKAYFGFQRKSAIMAEKWQPVPGSWG